MQRIFILTDNYTNTIDYPTPEEILDSAPYLDYICETDDDSITDSINLLQQVYKIKANPKENNIYSINRDELKNALLKRKQDRINWLRKYLKKPDKELNLWLISYEIYNKPGFLFWIPGWGLLNELDFLEEALNKMKLFIYIIDIYDYHA